MERGIAGIVLSLSLGLLGSSHGGTLGNFEEAVARPVSHSDHDHPSSREERDHSDGSETVDNIVVSVVAGLAYGACRGVKYVVYDWWAKPDKDPGDAALIADSAAASVDEDYDAGGLEGIRHKTGTPGLPYVRFDYRWQYIDSDLDANDFLLEAGYKYVAFYGRFTRYEDRAANETLKIEQYYGMLRYGGSDDFFFPGSFQIGAGVGGFVIDGRESQSGAALTIPVMLYPSDYFGIEFRPAWASINDKTISDYDISISAGQRFLHARAGYRWLWVQGEGHWLNGPYAGLSINF